MTLPPEVDALDPEQLVAASTGTSDARTDAERLLASARGFASLLDASVAGAGERAFDGPNCAVAFFMLAQAAELAIKAFLRSEGECLDTLTKAYGHNLQRSLKAARKHGFAAAALPTIWFTKLSQLYMKGKQLQYPITDGFVLPPILATREMVDGFIKTSMERIRGTPATPDVGVGIGFSAVYPGWSLVKAREAHPDAP